VAQFKAVPDWKPITPTQRAERFVGQCATKQYKENLIDLLTTAENDVLERAALYCDSVQAECCSSAIRNLKHKLT
jgi:hypothetical protein